MRWRWQRAPVAAVCAFVLGAVKVGAWVFDLASSAGALRAQRLIGLVTLAAVVGLGWLVMAAAVWLDSKLSDVIRRFR